MLGEVSARVEGVGDEVREEFDEVVQELDRANGRLQKTLEGLKGRVVESKLGQTEEDSTDGEGEEDDDEDGSGSGKVAQAPSTAQSRRRTLIDFIDSTTHEQLQTSVRADIDAFHSSSNDFSDSLQTFQSALQIISTTLIEQSSIGPVEKRTLYDTEPPPTARTLFHDIEDHAAAMAELLQGLVRHYDLCVSALKHTEGGGEAAREAVQPDPPSDAAEQAGVEESLYLRKVPIPISDSDRDDLIAVLQRDAAELDDVLTEIRDRNVEQDTYYERLLEFAKVARKHDAGLREALVMLHEIRELHLPAQLHAMKTFQAEWTRLRASMSNKMAALLELEASNEAFIAAYAELLKEVQRRESVKAQMFSIASKARKELRKLSEVDERARAEFVEEWGGSLPNGLWDAQDEGRGVKWEVREVRSGER